MAKKVKEEKFDAASIVSDLIKQYKDEKFDVGSGKVDCDFIDIGNYAMNYILSGNFDAGLPVGAQVIEVHGESASGKSVLCYNIMSLYQKAYPDGVVILDDAENAFVEYLGGSIQIDHGRLVRISSTTVEDHANMVYLGGPVSVSDGGESKMVDVKVPLVKKFYDAGIRHIMVVTDSVAVLSTRHEIEVGMDKPDMSKAKVLKAFFRTTTDAVKRYNVTSIFTNHMIAKIGAMPFEPKSTTSGGSGIVYQANVRILLDPAGKVRIKDTDRIIGVKTRVTTVKNRFAPPLRTTELYIMFDSGISKYSGLIGLFKNLGVLDNADGGWFLLKGTDIKFQERQLPDRWEEIKKVVMGSNILKRDFSKDEVNETEQK